MTRDEAGAAGLKRYDSAITCRNGHENPPRWVKNDNCAICDRDRARRHRAGETVTARLGILETEILSLKHLLSEADKRHDLMSFHVRQLENLIARIGRHSAAAIDPGANAAHVNLEDRRAISVGMFR